MANILLGSNDKASGATLSDGSWSNLNNLKSTNFGLQAVSTDAQAANTKFRLDLGANYVVRALALANNSLTKNALWRVRLGQAPMDIDFGTGVGDTRLTASGGANGTRFNESGLMVAGTAPRYDFDRLSYWNGLLWSDDLTQSVWGASNARAIDPSTVAFGAGASGISQGNLTLVASTKCVISGKLRLASGIDGAFRLTLFDGSALQFSTRLTATSKWQRFRAELVPTASTVTSANGQITITRGQGGDTALTSAVLQIKNLQIQTLPTDRIELPYRATTTTRIFRCLGVLREEARTNSLIRSKEFDNATWTKAALSATADQTTSPDGTVNADVLTPTTVGSVPRSVRQTVTTSSGGYWTATVYAKVGTMTQNTGVGQVGVAIVVEDNTLGHNARANFNLFTGVAGTTAITGGSWTNTMASMEALGDGWFRCRLSFNVTTVITSLRVSFYLGAFANTADTAGTIFVWGAQLEQGSFPTSLIVTTTATVTRTDDVIQATGGNFSSWYTSSLAGTLYAEFSRRFDSPDTTLQPVAVGMSDGSSNNAVMIFSRTGGDTTDALVIAGAGVQATFSTASALTFGATAARVAVGYQLNDFAYSSNGAAVQLDTGGVAPSGLTQLDVGTNPGSTPLSGHVRRVAYWPWRLTDAELQALTTTGPGAVDYDSGWTQARLMEFTDDEVPTNWAAQYSPMQAFASTILRYGTVEFLDTSAISLGRLFICGGFQPATNASYGLKDGRTDLSTVVKALSGKKYSTARRRLRTAEFALDWLSQTEADTLAELHALIGTTDEVLYVPDQDDMAFSQRYGGIGTLSELSPIDFPHPLVRAIAVRWEEKL